MEPLTKIACTCVLVFFALPLFVTAYVDEGPVLWTSGGNIMERTQSEVSGQLSAATVAVSGVDAKFLVVKAAPTKKEYILGAQDSAGTLHAYHSTDGKTWTQDWTVNIGDSNVARFDLAYEQSTGRAVIVYRGRIAGGHTTFYSRIWNGSWAGQTETTINALTGNVGAIKLASRNGTAQLGLVVIDDTHSVTAGFWSGSAWSMYTAKITANGSMYSGFTGTYPPMRNADVAFESQSGDMLVVTGENSSNHARYISRSAAGAWSAVGAVTSLSSYGDYSRLQSSPTTDEIIYSSCMMEPSNADYECDFIMWNGSGFGSDTSDSSVGTFIDGYMPADAFWLSSGSNRAAVIAYDGQDAQGLNWVVSVNGGGFVIEPVDTTAPTISAARGQIVSAAVTGVPSQALVAVADANGNVYFKRATLSGGSAVTWSSVVGGVSAEITQGTNPISSNTFGRLAFAMQVAPPLLVVATSSATSTVAIPSATTQYVDSASCTDSTSCEALALSVRGKGAVTVSSIKLTNNGTLPLAATTGWTLGVDVDGNPNNGVTQTANGTVSGNTISFTFSPALSINNAQTVYLFPSAKFNNGAVNATAGQTLKLTVAAAGDVSASAAQTPDVFISGVPTVLGVIAPNITTYTNASESTLSYSLGCTACGGRIGPSVFAQNITITGFGFGADPGASARSTATNQVLLYGAAGTTIANANVSSWSDTQIIIALNSATTGNGDADFGTNYGGTNALYVLAGGQWSAGLNFSLLPQITGAVSPTGLGPDGAKVYASGDSDGVVTLTGTRFGAARGTGGVTVLGCSATTCSSPVDSATTTSWTNTSVTFQIPTTIAANSYTGNIVLLSGANGLAAIYGNTFSIRPRVISITPASGGFGDAVTIAGDHLCPPVGTCPTGTVGTDVDLVNGPGFSSSTKVSFNGALANYWNTWSNAQIQTKVPSTIILGSAPVTVTAGGWNAGTLPFTAVNNVVIAAPTGLLQYSASSTLTLLATGGYSSAPALAFGAIASTTSGIAGSTHLAFEIVPVGTNFSCGASACATELTGPSFAGPGVFDCTVAGNNCYATTTPADNAYHWRARTELVVSGTTYYGPWASYPDVNQNLEAAADLYFDHSLLIITNLSPGAPGTNGTTISWNTNKNADSLVELNKTGTFTNNCVAADGCTGASMSQVTTHAVQLANLDSNTAYFYRVRSVDAAGNVVWSVTQQFLTLGVTQPAKTLFFHVASIGGTFASGTPASSSFAIVIPESGVQYQSIFVDVRGLYQTTGAQPAAQVTIGVNGESPVAYTLPGGSAFVAPWRIYHRVASLNLSPGVNSFTVTPGADTTLSGVSADVVVTFKYTP